MTEYTVRNVNEAYTKIVGDVLRLGIREETRNGPAMVYPEPVLIHYQRPWERVLLSDVRRANPFFHLFEAFWMLAGHNDAAFLDRYVHDYGKRFAENGVLWGAYGDRWRGWCGPHDQIEWVVEHLKHDPQSRRAVIQMYDPGLDQIVPDEVSPRDIPCNTTIYLRVRDAALELTVCCRSNDAIWGAFGANAVHFSVLQEYLAWRLGLKMGPMHQFSHNLHVYESTRHLHDPDHVDPYEFETIDTCPLFTGQWTPEFETELRLWLHDPSNNGSCGYLFSQPFNIALIPMSRVHDLYREKKYNEALQFAAYNISPCDWSVAAIDWIRQQVARKKAAAE